MLLRLNEERTNRIRKLNDGETCVLKSVSFGKKHKFVIDIIKINRKNNLLLFPIGEAVYRFPFDKVVNSTSRCITLRIRELEKGK